MAHQLVHHVGLGRVEGRAGVARVLRREGRAAAQLAQERAGGHQPGRRSHGEARGGRDLVHLAQLRDAVVRQPHARRGLDQRCARQGGAQRVERGAHEAPHLVLGRAVVHVGHRAVAALEGHAGERVAPRAGARVAEAGAVAVELDEVGGAE